MRSNGMEPSELRANAGCWRSYAPGQPSIRRRHPWRIADHPRHASFGTSTRTTDQNVGASDPTERASNPSDAKSHRRVSSRVPTTERADSKWSLKAPHSIGTFATTRGSRCRQPQGPSTSVAIIGTPCCRSLSKRRTTTSSGTMSFHCSRRSDRSNSSTTICSFSVSAMRPKF
jgi:hypothetical protein